MSAITINVSAINGVPTRSFDSAGVPFYLLQWDIVLDASGAPKNVRPRVRYLAPGKVQSGGNIYAATTYAEVQIEAASLGLTIPATAPTS